LFCTGKRKKAPRLLALESRQSFRPFSFVCGKQKRYPGYWRSNRANRSGPGILRRQKKPVTSRPSNRYSTASQSQPRLNCFPITFRPPEAARRTIPRLANTHDSTILRVEYKNDFDTTIPPSSGCLGVCKCVTPCGHCHSGRLEEELPQRVWIGESAEV